MVFMDGSKLIPKLGDLKFELSWGNIPNFSLTDTKLKVILELKPIIDSKEICT